MPQVPQSEETKGSTRHWPATRAAASYAFPPPRPLTSELQPGRELFVGQVFVLGAASPHNLEDIIAKMGYGLVGGNACRSVPRKVHTKACLIADLIPSADSWRLGR